MSGQELIISETLNIKYPQISKLVKELYYKLFDDEELDFKFEFNKVEEIWNEAEKQKKILIITEKLYINT